MSDERKWLGKIESCNIGSGGYQDAQFGISFVLGGTYHVGDFWGAWGPDIEHSPRCQWTDAERHAGLEKAFWRLALLMKDAKVTDFRKLVGVPIEVTSTGGLGGTLKSWRILTEVL